MARKSGAGPQTLRNIPGNVFQNQPQPGPRSNALSSARLQNGKIGSGSGWAFPGAMGNNAQGAQARPGQSNMTSFAQTIGGAQNQASLDPSERLSAVMAPKRRWRKVNISEGNPSDIPLSGPGRQPEEHRIRLGDHSRAPSGADSTQLSRSNSPSFRPESIAAASNEGHRRHFSDNMSFDDPHVDQLPVRHGKVQSLDGNAVSERPANVDEAVDLSRPELPQLSHIGQTLSFDQAGGVDAANSLRQVSPAHDVLDRLPDATNMHPQTYASALKSNNIAKKLTISNREFPSLSGTPQAQHQHPAAIWGNNIMTRGNAGSRQQSHTPTIGQQSGEASHGPVAQRSDTSDSAAFGSRSSGADDVRFDERTATSRMPGQQSSGDDFPPLGGLGEADLRAPSAQARFNGNSSALYGQQTQPASRAFESQPDSRSLPNSGSTITPNAVAQRSIADGSLDDQNAFARRQDTFALPHRGPPLGPGQPSSGPGPGPEVTTTTSSMEHELQQMSSLDRYGLNGLLAQLRAPHENVTMMLGSDLNTLGLDLHRPEPLWSEWPGPFSSPHSNPLIPDYRLPAAYAVHNVPPIHTRISSFSDETLFMIFYGQPRDVIQEAAAQELYARDWRWHKKMQQWMMKAKEYGDPVPLPSAKEERGWYYFFDVNNWRRERKEFILNYEHLYHGHNTGGPLTMP